MDKKLQMPVQLPENIKSAAKLGNNNELIVEYFKSIENVGQLDALKENKIFYNLMNAKMGTEIFSDIINKYLDSIQNIEGIDITSEQNYLDFVILTSGALKVMRERLDKELCFLSNYNFEIFLCSYCTYINRRIKSLISDLAIDVDEQKNHSELTVLESIHRSNGYLVDLLRAASYLVSLCSEYMRGESYELIPDSTLERLTNASLSNRTFQDIADKVCFGEWVVKDVDWNSNEVFLDFKDIELIRSRYLGIRSNIFRGDNKKRTIWERYQFVAQDMADGFCQMYERDMDVDLDRNLINTRLDEYFKHFGYEDELLIVSSVGLQSLYQEISPKENLLLPMATNEKIVEALYYVGISLICQMLVLEALNNVLDSPILYYRIPIDITKEYLSQVIDEHIIDKAFDLFISSYPDIGRMDMLSKPFIKNKDGEVHGLYPFVIIMDWGSVIRNTLISGGKIGDGFGRIWEYYIKNTFELYSWNIICQDKKIFCDGKIITDLDLMAEKNGLVLLIQMKSISSVGTIYEHWKARNTIKKAIMQAKLAATYIDFTTLDMTNLLKDVGKSLGDIKKIQPIVIIPSVMFSGWVNDEIPVVGFDRLLAILEKNRHRIRLMNLIIFFHQIICWNRNGEN